MLYPNGPFPIKEDKLHLLKKFTKIVTFEGKWGVFWYLYFVYNALLTVDQLYYAVVQPNIQDKLEVVVTLVFDIQVCSKLLLIYSDKKRISEMYRIIEEEFLDTSVLDKQEERKLLSHFDTVFQITKVHLISSAVSGVVVMIFPPTEYPEGIRNKPWLLYFPFDSNPTPIHEILFATLATTGMLCLFTIYVHDYLFIYFAQHLIVQLKLVKVMMENIAEEVSELDDFGKFHSNEFQEECYRRIGVCAKHHSVLLRFGNNLKKFASTPSGLQYFFAIFTGVTMQCLSTWAIEKGNLLKAGQLGGALLCMYNSVAVYTYHGSELQEESLNIITSMYQCHWYLCKPAFRKAVVFMQLNSQDMKISGFKLIEINNNTIVTIIRTTFSIVTLLRALNN